ncbi:hypothetical protein LSTR_LSTR012271 [Laodelphax striatellus]|uniref:trypsin n=1 Tax=Laodelphax striatellus TaxID=195883 RepID=A0A482WK87_LAOST|nr:hypothetical protein LSTR_LSTR012271 [Laodelphax striatellus]
MKFFIFLTNLISSFLMLVDCDRRVFGGSTVNQGQFPYQVSVLLKDNPVCTGTIIDESWVITAAHCVIEDKKMVSSSDVSIRVGYVRKDLGSGQVVRASDLAMHPDYTTLGDKMDLALIKLQTPLEFSDQVRKIHLSADPWPPSEGRMCTIAGYGSTENKTINELRFLQVKAFHGRNTCPCITKNVQLERLICLAPRKGQGACFHDVGGGLVCDGKVEGIIILIMDKRTCRYFTPDSSTDCRSKHVYSTCLYICPVLDWIKKYVPSVPPTPKSCNGCIKEAPSIIVLSICLYILAIGLL